MSIVVVDYGLGNIFSVMAALNAIDLKASVDTDGSRIAHSSIALLPGVAAFGAGMNRLRANGQAAALDRHHAAGRVVVGLCLGAQMLLNSSDEAPGIAGLGFVAGRSARLDPSLCTVPSQGWFQVEAGPTPVRLAEEINGQYAYFSHGYHLQPEADIVLTAREEDATIVAAFAVEGVLGVQFHPERSGAVGLQFLHRVLTDVA